MVRPRLVQAITPALLAVRHDRVVGPSLECVGRGWQRVAPLMFRLEVERRRGESRGVTGRSELPGQRRVAGPDKRGCSMASNGGRPRGYTTTYARKRRPGYCSRTTAPGEMRGEGQSDEPRSDGDGARSRSPRAVELDDLDRDSDPPRLDVVWGCMRARPSVRRGPMGRMSSREEIDGVHRARADDGLGETDGSA